MRRIDVLSITLGLFLGGGLLYLTLRAIGIEGMNAGIWTQALLILGLVGWVGTYLVRVVSQKMTLNQQLDDYKLAVLQKRYESLSPEEQAALAAEVEAERQRRNT
ncbi:MAG: DUF3007 family protein [Prochlorotrichaceae cyanobacterium]